MGWREVFVYIKTIGKGGTYKSEMVKILIFDMLIICY